MISRPMNGMATYSQRPFVGLNHRYSDCGAIVLLLCLTVLVTVRDLRPSEELVRGDVVTFFVPMFSFLGERLRAGDIPGWNPHQFAGAPFAGDPESGWGYIPSMVLFSAFAPATAIAGFVLFHLALSGTAAYVLARVLGLTVVGALVAAVIYEFSWMYERSTCCPAFIGVSGWLPVALLGAELAVRGRGWLGRLGWWSVSGLAVSQMLAAWTGQGAYYGLLTLGSYLAYRLVIAPPTRSPRVVARIGALLFHGGAILTVGFSLAATSILPRLEYNALSNVAGGEYQGTAAWAAESGGWIPAQILHEVIGGYHSGQWWYAGAAAVALAAVAPVAARLWFATPYFAILSVMLLLLTLREPTPLHSLLYVLLPWFQLLHSHEPNRILIVFYLGVALLAGATVSYLNPRKQRQTGLAIVAIALGVLLVAGARLLDERLNWPISSPAQIAFNAATSLLVCYACFSSLAVRRLIPVMLLLIVLWDSAGRMASAWTSGDAWHNNELSVDLATYVQPTEGAEFLRKVDEQPFRFIGHNPEMASPEEAMEGGYRRHIEEQVAVPLLVNNRATLLGLDDVQGYNPVQLQRYVEYINALNGQAQNYHELTIFPAGLASPLLDLLNVRYVVIPASGVQEPVDLSALASNNPLVYEDAQVQIFENTEALPRAWIVHDARQVARGEGLALLTGEAVDPRQTVLLETTPPTLDKPVNPTLEQVTVNTKEPDRVELEVESDGAGLLVVSESYDPSWAAEVNGESTDIYVANHALQALLVPDGESTIELRYESPMLRLGTIISAAAVVTLVVLAAVVTHRGIVDPLAHRRALDSDKG